MPQADNWSWGLQLVAYGYEGKLDAVVDGVQVVDGNRIEYVRGDLTEWYINRDDGLEQGFTLDSAPTSDARAGSPLVLAMVVRGDQYPQLSSTGQAIDFYNAHGERIIHYGKLQVFDANQEQLPAHLSLENCAGDPVPDSCQILLHVEDQLATYPITIDPIATTPDWTHESNQADANLGEFVGTAGDVNGDGYADILLGAPYYDAGNGDEGRLFLFYGSATGPSTTPDWTVTGEGGANLGISAGTAGDVNNDGYDDVIIGATYSDSVWFGGSADDGGKAFVYLGSATGLGTTAVWSIAETVQGDADLGRAVGTAGDVNGDGYDDVIIGAPGYSTGINVPGRAYVYYGNASGINNATPWIYDYPWQWSSFARAVSTAGDVNGDGYDDVVIGTAWDDAAYAFYGSTTGLGSSPDWTASGNGAQLGHTVSSAGDVNGDGYDDVIIGDNLYSNGETEEGRALVYYGSTTGLSANPDWTYELNQANAELGFGVANAGDVNGDGYDDILVGTPRYDNGASDEGAAFLFFGSASSLSTTPDWTVESDTADALLGYYVGTAGDVNDDSYDDMLVGAPLLENGQSNEGIVSLYYGAGSGTPPTATATISATNTAIPTITYTPTVSATETSTATPTHTPVVTNTPTATYTPTLSPTFTATPTATPTATVTTTGRITTGLLALYNFAEGSGATVTDVSGVSPALNLTITDTNNVTWLAGGGLRIDTPTLIHSGSAATKLIAAAVGDNALTFEAWVAPANLTQTGPARLMTISADSGKRNMTFGQDGDFLNGRMRTTTTSNNGIPAMDSPAGGLTTGMHHLVFTRSSDGTRTIYIDGVAVVSDTNVTGNLSNWNTSYEFALANELTGNRSWLGTYHLVAVYDQALSDVEVTQNFSAGIGDTGHSPTGTLIFEDTFTRTDSGTIGNGWVEAEATGAAVSVQNNALCFVDTSDIVNFPRVSHRFVNSDSGLLTWTFDLDWTRSEAEGAYRLMMQLGDGALMNGTDANAGIGVNLAWTENGGTHEQLVYHANSSDTPLTVAIGNHQVQVVADLDTNTYAIRMDGAPLQSNIPFDKDVDLNTVRFLTSGLNEANFTGMCFDDVQVVTDSPSLPTPWISTDIGNVGITGSATGANGTFALQGSGTEIGGTTDGFHYVYHSLSGDGTITAQVAAPTNTGDWAFAGLMIRESLDADARHVMIGLRPDDEMWTVNRNVTAGTTNQDLATTLPSPIWLRLVRTGDAIASYYSTDGQSWLHHRTSVLDFGTDAYVGLAVTAYNNNALTLANFSNVTVSGTVPPTPTATATPTQTPTMTPTPDQTVGSISGVAQISDGTTILFPNAVVMLVDPATDTILNHTFSDDNGQYQFENVAGGSYDVVACGYAPNAINDIIFYGGQVTATPPDSNADIFATFNSIDTEEACPVTIPELDDPNVLTVYAARVDGIYPRMVVEIDSSTTYSVTSMEGDPLNHLFTQYTLVHDAPINVEDVKIHLQSGQSLYVDKIAVNGVTYESEAPTTYATGIEAGLNCLDGYFQTEMLSCPGYFQYAQLPANWQQITTTNTPNVNREYGMVYDSNRDVVVLYGGNGSGWAYSNETWEFDGTDWSQVTTTQSPNAVYGMDMVYDSNRNVTVLFGGNDVNDTTLGETWEYNGTNWTQVTPTTSPPARAEHNMVYDPASSLVYLFGGNNRLAYFNGIWTYNGTTWSQVPTTNSPPARTLASVAVDSANNSLLLFGGRDSTGTALGDTWTLNLGTNVWSEIQTTSPPNRTKASMVYDPIANNIVLVGGLAANEDTQLNDTWLFTANSWSEATPTQTAPMSIHHTLVYDSTDNAILLFTNGQTWEYK